MLAIAALCWFAWTGIGAAQEAGTGAEANAPGAEAEPESETGKGTGKGSEPESEAESESAPPLAPDDEPEFGARAEVAAPKPAARKLEAEAMRDVPGAFGDPFRVVDTLPGVVPLLSGVPYVYVRGAPPAGTIYLYDDIAVPALFHLALGPAVIHPALIGDLDFYSAVAPARYGRHVGGVFAAEGPARFSGPLRGEFEIRLLDTQAMLDVPIGDARVTVAGRYGYPGLALSIFAEDVVLAYWDYQLRASIPISPIDRVELTWFGSYDKVGEKNDDDDSFSLEFHRAEARVIRELADLELGLAVQGGYERSGLGETVRIEAVRLGPRVWSIVELGGGARARFGADMLATSGSIDDVVEDRGDSGSAIPPQGIDQIPGGSPMPAMGPMADPSAPMLDPSVPPPAPGEAQPIQQPPPQQMFEEPVDDEEQLFDDPFFSAVAARNQFGIYAEFELPFSEDWRFEPGLRFDAWLSGREAQVALEPRAILSWQALEPLALHAAFGLGHQLAALPIPLPGFNDVALEHGLQEAIRGEVGVTLTPLPSLLLSTEVFYTHLTDLLLPRLFIECVDNDDYEVCPDDGGLPRGNVDAYGVELFVKRDASEDLSGWISYTLAWADGHAGGKAFTPEFDVRHVANLVLAYRIGGGFSAGTRLHYRTGKLEAATIQIGGGLTPDGFEEPLVLRYEQRLPPFFRLDVQISYGWMPDWGKMRITLEWLNATLSKEPIGLDCNWDDFVVQPRCGIDYTPAIFVPNLALRAEY